MSFVTRITTCALIALAGSALASSHREAPFLTKNPKVDGTDVYFFRSYETGRSGYVTLIANYQPLQEPGGGPNFFNLDPEALYEIHIDNNADGREDLTFQFRFNNTLNNSGEGIALPIGPSDGGMRPNVPVAFANVGDPRDRTKLSVLETFTVNLVQGPRRTGTVQPIRSRDFMTCAPGGVLTTRMIESAPFSFSRVSCGIMSMSLFSNFSMPAISTAALPRSASINPF